MALTLLQQKFADLYIKLGNATQAAKEAGYSEKTAYSIGNENLKKPEIKTYISERLVQIEKESIASIDEVMKFYTKVMRGQEKDQFGLDASLSDRIKAGGEIIKRLSAGNQNTPDVDDDNLIEALENTAEQLFDDGDDSDMLPNEEDE